MLQAQSKNGFNRPFAVPPVPKKKNSFLKGCLIIFLVLFLGISGYLYSLHSTYKQFETGAYTGQNAVTLEILPGQTIDQISANLVEAGFFPNKEIFGVPLYKIYLRFNTVDTAGIQTGKHILQPNTKYTDAFSLLKQPGCFEKQFTLREGLRIEEIAEELDNILGSENYNKEKFISLTKDYNNPEFTEFSNQLKVPTFLEGYLFPDTYRVCADITTEEVIVLLLKNFDTKIIKKEGEYLSKSKFNMDEILKIASMVEREGRGLEEKKMIAAIMIKRLEIGMPLGIDATTQYEFGYSEKQKTWWRKGVELDNVINSEHRYSTRTNVGLPPTPIANPGFNSLVAVIEPTTTDYLFYITGNDGNMYYAKDVSGHNRNVCKYITMTCR